MGHNFYWNRGIDRAGIDSGVLYDLARQEK
jgi:hypothetical protein